MKRLHWILSAAMTLSASVALQAQQSLEEVVQEAGVQWAFGRWKGQTENGDTIIQQVRWDLDKHIVAHRGQIGDQIKFMGITGVNPETGDATYTGFDNRGGTSKGTWTMEGGDLVLRIEGVSPDGNTWKGAVVFAQAGDKKLEMRMHSLDQWGDLEYPARFSITLTKMKAPARRPQGARARVKSQKK